MENIKLIDENLDDGSLFRVGYTKTLDGYFMGEKVNINIYKY